MNSAAPLPSREPLTVLIAALGGQGGGVLTDWIVQAARAQGFVVQATSTPGVSQRTGATTYYLEIAQATADGATPPVLGLAPVPGRVDVLICAELLEAARMLERGMCTPTRTTVVASTHRVYTTREKMSGGDGRVDDVRIVDALRALSHRNVLFDMEAVRSRHRAAISAALFGAVAGSGALPIARAACEKAISAAGKGIDASLAAFAAAFECAERAEGGAGRAEPAHVAAPRTDRHVQSHAHAARLDAELAARIDALPESVAELARHGVTQLVEYQDIAYARRYVERIERVARAEAIGARPAGSHLVTRETARYLALWMGYDDVIRVAAQKSRASRFARIRNEVHAGDAEIVRVYDFFKPSAFEIAAVLPRRLGKWLEHRIVARSASRHAGSSITLQTSSISGALALRFAAVLRPLRPHSLRFGREQQAIEQWLAIVEQALAAYGKEDTAVALELARLPRLLKGYGDTHSRGHQAFQRIVSAYNELASFGSADLAKALHEMTQASLDNSECAPPAISPRASDARVTPQKIVWVGRR